MLLQSDMTLLPPQVLRDPRINSCSVAAQKLTPEYSNLVVAASVSRGSITVHAKLIASEGTSSAQTNRPVLRAFIRMDNRSMLLNLPPGGYVSFTFLDVSPGRHDVQYGVFVGSSLLNGGAICVRVP